MMLRRRTRKVPLWLWLLRQPFALTAIGAVLGIGLASTIFPTQNYVASGPSFRIIAELLLQQTSRVRLPPFLSPLRSSRAMFQNHVPYQRTYYAPCSKSCHPTIRAYHELGWQKVDRIEDATVVHTDINNDWFEKVNPWQRYNHIDNSSTWSHKNNLVDGLRRYERNQPNHRDTSYFPRTLRLNREDELEELNLLRKTPEGKSMVWVWLKGMGLSRKRKIIHTNQLNKAIEASHTQKSNVEHYAVCRPVTWRDGRPLAVRTFWLVASTDPLIVLYQDGYTRIAYNETFPRLWDDELQVSFDDLATFIRKQHARSRIGLRGIGDPMQHLRNQFKEATSIFVDVFKDTTFKPIESGDGYELYAFDFVIDRTLDVFLFDAFTDTFESGGNRQLLHEDYYFLLQKGHELEYGMALTLEEIWEKQSRGENILPLKSTGEFELVYAGDVWKYEYKGYKRDGRIRPCLK